MHRTQIYLDEQQERALSDRARRAGRTKSALIREAIDDFLAPQAAARGDLARLRAAVAATAGAAPYLPSGAAYAEELRDADAARERELAARRG